MEPIEYRRDDVVAIAGCSHEQLTELEARDLVRARPDHDLFSAEMLRRVLLLRRLVGLGVSMDQLAEGLALPLFERGGATAQQVHDQLQPLLTMFGQRIDDAVRAERDDRELSALIDAQLTLAAARECLVECAGCRRRRAACRVCEELGRIDATSAALLAGD